MVDLYIPKNKNDLLCEWRLFLCVVIMALLALVRELAFFPVPDFIPNPDSAWLIYAAQRVADGQKLYVDIMESNPPLIIWLSMPAVWLGKLLNMQPIFIFDMLATLLSALSITIVARIIRSQGFFADRANYGLVMLYISCGFFLMTPAIYGQREVLFIAMVLPYLFLSLAPIALNARSFAIMLMAAVGLALKPFFLLLWVMNELKTAIERRKATALFSWHNWLIGMVQVIYLFAIYYFTPEYFSDLLPALLVTYFSFAYPWESLWQPIAKVAVASLAVAWLAKLGGEYKVFTGRALIWLAACAGLILMQRKDWINHLYPMVFMAGLVISISLVFLLKELKIRRMEIGNRRFAALCIALALFAEGAYLGSAFTYNILTKPAQMSIRLMAEIEKKAAGKYVYPLMNGINPSFPSISLTRGIFHGGFAHLWPLMGIVIRQQQGENSPEFIKAKKWFFDTLVRDFTNYPPELVWVNDNVNMGIISTYFIEPENRNFIGVLSRDERFAKIWQNYEKYAEIEIEPDPAEIKEQSEEEKLKKPERISLYIRKAN